MWQGSSGEVRVILLREIVEQIRKMLSRSGSSMTLEDIVSGYPELAGATETEIREAIDWGVRNGYLEYNHDRESKPQRVSSTTKMASQFRELDLEVVMSIPRFTELGLDRTKRRYRMVETRVAFRRVLTTAKKTLRVSSPFIQENILDKEGLPDLPDLLKFAFERGCEIRLLSRELNGRRRGDVEWLTKLAIDEGYRSSLKLFDYHFEDPTSGILSSTHAKLLIADDDLAYIGSAEIRRNSLSINFEIGCLVAGPIVSGLCEAFDLMTSYSTRVF
jgi:phosphatidylserine/phosphatidylglycerophosphate/cardiolipin synthase-like enzyme